MADVRPIALEGFSTISAGGAGSPADWVAAAAAGSEEMFARLIEQFRPVIWGVAWRITLEHDSAWDVTQQIVLRIWRALPKYRPEQNLAGWIRTISVREGLRYLEYQRKLIHTIGLDDIQVPPPSMRVENQGPRTVIAGERRELIRMALDELSGQQRAAIILRFYEDLSLGEIATAMECSEGSVKQHLFRAMEKLRRVLKKDEQP